jgi:uncharacterized protein
MRKAIAQYTSNVERTVCKDENTTESRSSIKNTFHNVVEKRNPYQYENRRRRLNRRRRRVCVRRTKCHIYQGH